MMPVPGWIRKQPDESRAMRTKRGGIRISRGALSLLQTETRRTIEKTTHAGRPRKEAGSRPQGHERAGGGWPPRPGTRGRAAAWAPATAAGTTSATPCAGTAGSGSPRPIVRALSHPEPARPCPFHEAVQGGPLGPLGPRWRIGPGSEGNDQMRCEGPSSGPSHGTSHSLRRAAAGPCPSRQKREARPASRALGDQMPVNIPTTGSAKMSSTP